MSDAERQSEVTSELDRLFEQCEVVCSEQSHLSPGGRPDFKLLYSSVESFVNSRGLMLLGLNPAAGTPDVAETEDTRLPYRDPRFSAYLDEEWQRGDSTSGRGQDPLQRAVQDILAILAGGSIGEVLSARRDQHSSPEDRVGSETEALIRETPAGNIVPFRSPSFATLDRELQIIGERIGWDLIRLARPRVLVLLANGPDSWGRILRLSGGQSRDVEQVGINRSMRRSYKQCRIVGGALDGTLIGGLPAIVRDKGRDDVMIPLLNLLSDRQSEITHELGAAG